MLKYYLIILPKPNRILKTKTKIPLKQHLNIPTRNNIKRITNITLFEDDFICWEGLSNHFRGDGFEVIRPQALENGHFLNELIHVFQRIWKSREGKKLFL